MILRVIKSTEIELAYKIIENRFQFLQRKNIDQYPYPFPPKEVYREKCKYNNNYGFFDNDTLLGIVTLTINEKKDGWGLNHSDKDYLWLSHLYTDIKFSGNNYSYKILDYIQNIALEQNINYLLLDCYKDGNFLEKFYTIYGFKKIDEKEFIFPGRKFNGCLMELSIK